MASACNAKLQTFPQWLRDNVKGADGKALPETTGKGRPKESQTKGSFGQTYHAERREAFGRARH